VKEVLKNSNNSGQNEAFKGSSADETGRRTEYIYIPWTVRLWRFVISQIGREKEQGLRTVRLWRFCHQSDRQRERERWLRVVLPRRFVTGRQAGE